MRFPALGEFVQYLESIGDLQRVKVEVDPRFELTEIATRALREQKPALFFERVRGSSFPVVMNVYASERRIEHALGEHPEKIGEALLSFFERIVPPKPSTLWRERRMVKRLLSARSIRVSAALSQEVVEEPDLDRLPIQTCWPKDGGRFLTMGQVFTYDPVTGRRNVGMYRLQVYDRKTTGMHIQIERGGGAHYYRAEQLDRDLEVAVALGTDPALLLATIAALPEDIDEVQFAAFLRGRAVPMTQGKRVSIPVPAQAEFVLEGVVPRKERRLEGPFGDHFGHYSTAAPFPVFRLRAITRRRSPVYPATVVGVPPMEDKYLGDATQQILGPLVRLIHKEVKDLWAYYEAGFHNLLVVSVEERYHKEAMKAALGLLGTGQLSLTKCLVLVSHDVNPRDWKAVLREIHDHFDPHGDFVLLSKVPLDTLDFTSYRMELGSKMIIDATKKERPRRAKGKIKKRDLAEVGRLDSRILDSVLIENTLLIVKVRSGGREVVEKLVSNTQLEGISIVAAVSEDVDLESQESYIWGIFTRFDCERDVVFTEQRLVGISPIYKGIMGIDATWKKGYPEPLVMDETIVKLVDQRWGAYWQ
jgi:4-hydroxy-3-polyprenylbenzoate decarboxylase